MPSAAATSRGHRSARENIDDLCEPGSFVEYGALVVAAQGDRRTEEDLVRNTPADGFICGLGQVSAGLFGAEASRAVVASYDYSVLAGTQGVQGHRKKDRLFELVERFRLPLVLFAEGGGGRPGDTAALQVSGLETMAFALFGRLSGLVPLVGVVSGRCFAGNAALLGCCDVIIATEDSSIGMAGPALIEGGGLGRFHPEDIGPVGVQNANGVIDVLVAGEADAVAAAKKYLGYFQGPLRPGAARIRTSCAVLVPEDRMRVYDVRSVVSGLADAGSVLELRAGWGAGMITALARLEGLPLGIVANNPAHLGGAIDADGARQGGPVRPAVRRLRPAFAVPLRHARFHGRARGGANGPGAAFFPDVRDGRQHHRAPRHRCAPQGLWAGCAGHGWRQLPGPGAHRGLADG